MGRFETAALGVVQGITEFLPVSSTAHLIIFSWLAYGKDGGLDLTVWLHAGTLAAIFVYFKKDWANITRGVFRSFASRSLESHEAKMGAGLLITVLPAVAAGLVFEYAVAGILRQPLAVAGGLLAGSAALFAADRMTGKTKRIDGISLRDCILLGIAQSFALVPGVSRSGISIAGGMFLGYTREDSAKFAFMMGVPAIASAMAHRLWENGFPFAEADEIILGFTIAAITGIVAIRFLLNMARSGNYTPFVIYRIAVAVTVIATAV